MPRKPKDPIKELLNHHDAPAPFLSWALDYPEEWGWIPGFECYMASNWGRIRRQVSGKGAVVGRMLKQQLRGNGYYYVNLYVSGVKTQCSVHSLVALAFIGLRPKGLCVNHKDGTRTNNRADNLEYCTHRENLQHAARMGRMSHPRLSGADHPLAKLSEDDVRAIRELQGIVKSGDIARFYRICTATVSHIWTGRQWSSVK